jgi:hypothetical protein
MELTKMTEEKNQNLCQNKIKSYLQIFAHGYDFVEVGIDCPQEVVRWTLHDWTWKPSI